MEQSLRPLKENCIYRWKGEYMWNDVIFPCHVCGNCPDKFCRRVNSIDGMGMVQYDQNPKNGTLAMGLVQVHKNSPYAQCDECGTREAVNL